MTTTTTKENEMKNENKIAGQTREEIIRDAHRRLAKRKYENAMLRKKIILENLKKKQPVT